MKKKVLTLVSLILFATIIFSGCVKDESEISGEVSYIGAITGIEYIAEGATVYLMTSETEYAEKTTADSDGKYSFYPIVDGTYFIEAEITVNLIDYSGKSEEIFTEKDNVWTTNLVLK